MTIIDGIDFYWEQLTTGVYQGRTEAGLEDRPREWTKGEELILDVVEMSLERWRTHGLHTAEGTRRLGIYYGELLASEVFRRGLRRAGMTEPDLKTLPGGLLRLSFSTPLGTVD